MTNLLNQFKKRSDEHSRDVVRDVSDDWPLPVTDYWLEHAINNIYHDYGVRVSVVDKHKDLLKFGRNPAVGTSRTTIMDLPSGVLNETYVSDNLITTVSSSSTSDTRTLTIEGHTISGNDLTFAAQTITLTGQTQVSLATPLARCTRIYAPDGDTTDLVGAIYAYEDDTSTAGVPDTAAGVHAIIPAGENQTRKASTSISSTDYWIITDFDCDVYDKTAGYAEVRMECRSTNGPWRPVESVAVSSGTHSAHHFVPYAIVPANSDVRLTAVADGANTDVGGQIQGVLANVVTI